ncbi:MAG: FecR domain-containing protein [Phycisphaeraceae bacterium JB051]
MKTQRLMLCLLLSLLMISLPAMADDSPVDPTKIIADQVLEGVVTGVRGMVQIRQSESDPWVKAQNGMKLSEGAEFRTGPRSAVQFKIPPDQTITLDRLGTMKLLTAVAENNKITTNLGMTYGRTRYDIRKAGFEHESTIRTPSATLSVRGTKVGIQDGAMGFVAWSTESRAHLFDQNRRQNMTFGEDTGVDGESDGAADNMKKSGNVDPGDSRGRQGSEGDLVVNRPGLNPNPGSGGPNIFNAGGPINGPITNFKPDFDNKNYYGVGFLSISLYWTATDINEMNYASSDLALSVVPPDGYENGVSTTPGSVPFTNALTSRDQVSVNTDHGYMGDDTSYYGASATEVIEFDGSYPLTNVVGVTNVYNEGVDPQTYQVVITGTIGENETPIETTFSNSVSSSTTNLHLVHITPTGQIIVSESVGVMNNYSNVE